MHFSPRGQSIAHASHSMLTPPPSGSWMKPTNEAPPVSTSPPSSPPESPAPPLSDPPVSSGMSPGGSNGAFDQFASPPANGPWWRHRVAGPSGAASEEDDASLQPCSSRVCPPPGPPHAAAAARARNCEIVTDFVGCISDSSSDAAKVY